VAFGKNKKEKFDPKKPVPVKPIKEKPSMWCRTHGCTKAACGCPS